MGQIGTNDLVGGTGCLHPNDAGHAKIAATFEAALAESSATPVARAGDAVTR